MPLAWQKRAISIRSESCNGASAVSGFRRLQCASGTQQGYGLRHGARRQSVITVGGVGSWFSVVMVSGRGFGVFIILQLGYFLGASFSEIFNE